MGRFPQGVSRLLAQVGGSSTGCWAWWKLDLTSHSAGHNVHPGDTTKNKLKKADLVRWLGFPRHHLGFSPRLPTNKRFCQRGSGNRLVSFVSSSKPAAKVVKGFVYGTEKANLPRREKQNLVSRKRQEQGPPHPRKGFDATLWKLTSSEPRRARLFLSGLCPAASSKEAAIPLGIPHWVPYTSGRGRGLLGRPTLCLVHTSAFH